MPLSFRMSHCVLPAPFLATALLFFPENFVGSVGCGAPSPSGACYGSAVALFSAPSYCPHYMEHFLISRECRLLTETPPWSENKQTCLVRVRV